MYVILRAIGDNASGKLFADDLALTVSLDNIRNPDFERHNWGGAVADEWSESFNATAPEFAVVPVEGANAGQAQKIAASQMGNGGYAWISQSNAVSGDSLYSLSGKIWATKLNGAKAQLYVDFFDANQVWVGSNSAEIGSATGDYTSLVVNGVTPGQATRAIVYCILKSEADNSEGELYVDDIHFNVFQ